MEYLDILIIIELKIDLSFTSQQLIIVLEYMTHKYLPGRQKYPWQVHSCLYQMIFNPHNCPPIHMQRTMRLPFEINHGKNRWLVFAGYNCDFCDVFDLRN